MKKQDYFFLTSVISFILCIGFNNVKFNTLHGLLWLMQEPEEANALLTLSAIFLIYIVLYLLVEAVKLLIKIFKKKDKSDK